MENRKRGKDWKDALLKSSLPLEHLVATLLEKHNVDSYGEFSYMRKNEKGSLSEHSIDIDAIFSFDTQFFSLLNFLIECKYCHQSVKWLFSPISSGRKEYNLLEHGLVKVFEECSPIRIDYSRFIQFESKLGLASKGIEIYTTDKNESAIKHGLYQLRYAMPNKAVSIIESQLDSIHDNDIPFEMLIPILVTTAQLYILNHGADIGLIQKADDISDIASRVDSLIVYQEPSVDLKEYTINLHKKIIGHPLFETWIKELNALLDAHKKNSGFLDLDLSFKFRRLPAKILVVNIDAFEKIIKKILLAAKMSVKTYDKFAVLKNDFEEHKIFFKTKAWFEQYEPQGNTPR